MQYFELLLLVLSTIYLFFNRRLNTKFTKRILVYTLFALLLFHLIIEGYRWQMIPAYLIWVLALVTAFNHKTGATKTVSQILKIIGLIVLLIPAILFPIILPVFDLPEPTGNYNVGTRDIVLLLNRAEIITENPNDKRELAIKVFYPFQKTVGIMDPYIDQGGRHGFALKYGLPKSTFNYLDKVNTHIYRDIEITEGTFPVLVFSHGYNSKANGYYSILSELASHGYIIFAINHTYESTGSTMNKGQEVYFDYNFAQSIERDTWSMMEPVVAAFKDDLSFEERHPIVKKGLTTYFVKDMVERWAQDISDVVTELESWNQDGFFKNRLDINHLGVIGHSRGGGAAGEALLKDKRIKAGVNLDGVQWGDIVNSKFEQPFLFVSADWPDEKEDLNSHAYIHKSKTVFYDAKILNTGHSNFMDIPLMIPYRGLSEAGSIDPKKSLHITNTLVRNFFDIYLKGSSIELTELNNNIQELTLEKYEMTKISPLPSLIELVITLVYALNNRNHATFLKNPRLLN